MSRPRPFLRASLIAVVLSLASGAAASAARADGDGSIHPALLEELSFGPDEDAEPALPAVATGVVPEPSTALLIGLGLAGLFGFGSRTRTR